MSTVQSRLHVLGSGSADPSAERKNSSYLLEWHDSLALVDCSGSPAHEVLLRGFELVDVRAVYLTHEHVDHIYALPSLIHGMWMRKLFRDDELRIFGTPSTLDVAMKLLAPFRLVERKGAVRIEWRSVSPDSVEMLTDDGEVSSHPVTHGPVEAVGYRFGGTLITGDCVHDERLDRAVSEGVHTVVMDCGGGIDGTPGHAGARQVADLLVGNELVRRAFLSHIGTAESGALLAALGDVDATVRVLEDGDVVEL